jgi:hypothetical protein
MEECKTYVTSPILYQSEQLRADVSRRLNREIPLRTFQRWKQALGLSRGRGAFYEPETVDAIVEFGQMVQALIPYREAHAVIYEKYGDKKNG